MIAIFFCFFFFKWIKSKNEYHANQKVKSDFV